MKGSVLGMGPASLGPEESSLEVRAEREWTDPRQQWPLGSGTTRPQQAGVCAGSWGELCHPELSSAVQLVVPPR